MADNGRWFKLWITAPYDPHLSNLSLEDFARWCLFGIYLKTHGNNGVIEIASPAIAIQQLFRVQNYDDIIQIIKCFPSCKINVTSVTTASVTWCNWLKYQGDFSGDRVRKFRDVKRTKKRGEEKRGEEKRITPIIPQKGNEMFDLFWSSYPRKIAKADALKAWNKIAPANGVIENIMTGLERAKECEQWKRNNGQFIPHPATWLNGRRWEDERAKAWNE